VAGKRIKTRGKRRRGDAEREEATEEKATTDSQEYEDYTDRRKGEMKRECMHSACPSSSFISLLST
jgi:hypothetical protein